MTASDQFRILHLARDEKFVDMAVAAFEKYAPGRNDLCLYAHNSAHRFVRTQVSKVHSKLDAIRGLCPDYLSAYDIIVIHSLHPAFFRTLLRAPRSVTLVWVGWGYDYYDLVLSSGAEALLPETQAHETSTQKKKPIRVGLKQWLERASMPSKRKVIERIDLFAPVLPTEYELVASKLTDRPFPIFARWNYGTLEDDLIRGFENCWVDSDAILVGNSAAHTSNHREALRLLANASTSQMAIIPLSYGSPENRDDLLTMGRALLGDRFVPLVNFIPIDQYNKYLRSCGYVLMNHVRQQAVGNIVTMMYLGARIFLREECETYRFLKAEGAYINSVQELERNPHMIHAPLSPNERVCNRQVVQKHWSREASEKNTRCLVEQALSLRDSSKYVTA